MVNAGLSCAGALAISLMLATATMPARADPNPVTTYRFLCDASAGAPLDESHFVVADDELDGLEIYRRGKPKPVTSVPLETFLEIEKGEEADLEGAARAGDLIYWISSHGRTAKGRFEPSRLRFFATKIGAGDPPKLTPVPPFARDLLADLVRDPKLVSYDLAAASRLAPEAPGGLAIEGLAAANGGGLLIGFRNPVTNGKALLVPLLDPAALLRGEKARFGAPIDLDLEGRGIRSIERVGDIYWILAGPPGARDKDDAQAFALYRWSGQQAGGLSKVPLDLAKDVSPEAIFAWPDGRLQILSDDGDVAVDGETCKKLANKDRPERRFRSLEIVP
jgi:hypothetical protein